jgi:hypothetical protein
MRLRRCNSATIKSDGGGSSCQGMRVAGENIEIGAAAPVGLHSFCNPRERDFPEVTPGDLLIETARLTMLISVTRRMSS